MKKPLFCLFLLINASFSAFLAAQTTVRVRALDEKEMPLKGIRLTFSSTVAPVATQSNGEFFLEFPAGQTELIFFPPSGFERISPPKGTLFLPEDKGRIIEIWLARKGGGDDREAETFARVLSKKEAEKARLQIENESLRAQLEATKTGGQNAAVLQDSFEKASLRNAARAADLTREIADLREAVDLRKQLFYKKIAGELVVFTDRLKDLRDALPRARDAFIDQKAMARLEKTITNYNSARDSVLQNRFGHVEIARALWGETIAESLGEAYAQTLEEVHQKYVLPLNSTLLEQFRAVRAEEIRPAKARKKADAAARATHEKLTALIPILEKTQQAVLRKMEAALH